MATINKAKLFDNASKFIQKNQLDRAIKELSKILKADPDDVRARLKIGDLYAKKGQTAEACEAYRIVAESYSNDGFFLKAVAVYKQILKLDPSLTEVHLKLGDLYHQLGLVSDAMQQYQIVANFYQSKGMNRESLDVLRRMVDLDPENVASRKNVAELLAREGHTEEALEEFRQIASDMEANNRQEDLIQVLERVIHLDGNDLDTVKRVASLYLERGDPKRALAKLQVLFRSNPQDLETLEMLSRAFLSLNQPHKAKSVYREMAKLYDQGGDNSARDQVLRKILELDPADADARHVLEGGAMPQASAPAPQPVPAQPVMQQPSAPAPVPQQPAAPQPLSSPGAPPMTASGGPADDPATISKLLTEADVYLKYGLLDRALDHLRNIISRNPDNFEAHAKLKEVYLQHKDTDNAVAEILILVELAQRAGRADEAQALLEEGAQISPGHPEISARLGGAGAAAMPGAPPVMSGSIAPPAPDEFEVDVAVEDAPIDQMSASSGTQELPMQSSDAAIEISIEDDDFGGMGDVEIDDPFTENVLDGGADIVDLDDHRGDTEADDLADALIAEVSASVDVPVGEQPVDEVSVDLSDEEFSGALDEGADVVSFDADMDRIGSDSDVAIIDDAGDMDFAIEADAVEDMPSLGEVPDVEAPVSADAPLVTDSDFPTDLPGLDDVGIEEPAAAESPSLSIAPEPAPAQFTAADFDDGGEAIPPECAEDADEAEFFLSQEIYDEAIRVLEKLCKKFPNSRALRARLNKARAAEAGDGAAAAASSAAPAASSGAASQPPTAPKATPTLIEPSDASGGFDLAAELAEELEDFEEANEPAFGADDQVSVDQVLEQFKKGVESNVGREDKQARFDLGLAYKDMGLWDESINEFEIAMQDEARRVECLGMIAVVQREKGDYDSAIDTFNTALDECKNDKQKPGLLFDLGLTMEAKGDNRAALDLYQRVQAIDPKFRGVASKIEELGGGGEPGSGNGSAPVVNPDRSPAGGAGNGEDPGDAEGDEDGSARKSKISYV